MSHESTYGAFNARWITPEEVARTFVAIPQFRKASQSRHSLLMGPRGCGKTTLLKMLTTRALDEWDKVRQASGPQKRVSRPGFEAIYVPADINWSFELASLASAGDMSLDLVLRTQKALVTLSAAISTLKTFGHLLSDDRAAEHSVALELVRQWCFTRITPTLRDLVFRLRGTAVDIRRFIADRRHDQLNSLLEALPSSFQAAATDAVKVPCYILRELVPNRCPARWCVCFDELEIAPSWLQDELLRELRSSDQEYLLKLTWSPVLPDVLGHLAQPQADYDIIRLWNSHVRDVKTFCSEFTLRFLQARLDDPSITPVAAFGRSIFAAEEKLDEGEDTYSRGSQIWESMVELAKRDPSFRNFLEAKGFESSNPVSDRTSDKDKILRKIKPVVVLRETFRGAGKARSRKRPAIYSGEDAIYSMSDGNPRWLSGILNELLDVLPPDLSHNDGDVAPLVRPSIQAQVLSGASRRIFSYVKAFPSATFSTEPARGATLIDVIRKAGKLFAHSLLSDKFDPDPVGSFILDSQLSGEVLGEVKRGLLLGAFIYVGDSALDVPENLTAARLRLSFMFSPMFRLTFRNFRAVSLSNILSEADPSQLSLFQNELHYLGELDETTKD